MELSPSRIGEIQITIGTTLFGICSVLMKVCLDDYKFNPFVLNGMRSLFSAALLISSSKKLKEIFKSEAIGETSTFNILKYIKCINFETIPEIYHLTIEKYVYIVVNGVTGWIGTSSFILAISFIGASKAGFLLSLYIIFVPLIEICLYLPDTNRVTPKMLVGVSLAFLGTYLLCGCGWHCAGALHWGDLYAIMGALGWASNIIIQNMAIKRGIHVVDLSLSSVFISCVLSLIVGVATDLTFFKPYGFPMHLSSAAWGLVIFIGIFEGIGYLLQALGFRYAEPTKASVLSGLESMVTLFVSHLLLGEKLMFLEYIGCVVLIVGSLVVIAPEFNQNHYHSQVKHQALATDDPDTVDSIGGIGSASDSNSDIEMK